MHLLIRAVSLAGQPLTQAISAYFDERGGTMGRSDTNTLALPDPERRISRLQAEVARVPEGWKLVNVGNANPIWHNNKAIAPGESVLLDEGDELQVGTYSLHVSHAANDPAARTITRGRPAADARTVIVGSGTEPRTDPSRMTGAQINLVSHMPTQMAPATPPTPPTRTAAHGLDADGATRLVPDAGRADVTQLVSPTQAGHTLPPVVPPAVAGPDATQSFAPLSPPPAAAPRSPFDDLLSPSPASAASPAARPMGGFGTPAASASSDPFADLLGPSGSAGGSMAGSMAGGAASTASVDPFAGFAGLGSAPSPSASVGSAFGAPSVPSAPSAPSAPAKLPDDFDPFADLMPASSAGSASPFDGMLGGGTAPSGGAQAATPEGGLHGLDFMGGQGGGSQGGATSSLDQMFGLSGGASSADPLAAFMARTAPAAPAEAAVGAPSSLDPLALLATAAPAPASAEAQSHAQTHPHSDAAQAALSALSTPAALPDHVPEIEGLMPLPATIDAPLTPPADAAAAHAAQRPQPAQPALPDGLFDDLGGATVLTPLGGRADIGISARADAGTGMGIGATPASSASTPAAGADQFDALLEGLAASVPPGESPVTMPGPLTVQSVELPAVAAQHGERPLPSTPGRVVVNLAASDAPAAASDPLLSPSGELALADPSPFDSLLPQAVQAPQSAHAPAASDPLSAFGLGAPASPAAPATAAPTVAMAPMMATTPAEAAHADTLALWSAFCQGAGVNFTPPQGLNPELMRVIGTLLRHAVDGTVKLVAARAATKQELRAEVTVIQAKGNNPLKFSPDAQSALEQLLQPPLRGFMAGPDAVSDAMDDLLGHVIGTMVGTRAALEGVLARFEPEQLEAKLVGRSVMDSLLPMNRRAKLWELYLQHYGAVRTEAQDDFHNLFGKAFLQAYEEQLDRLDAERRARKPA